MTNWVRECPTPGTRPRGTAAEPGAAPRPGRARVWAASAALLALLGACAERADIVRDRPGPGFVRDIAAATEGVDWSKAETVTVTLSDFAFTPAALSFRPGTPYRLVLSNVSDHGHTFTSTGFFEAIAAEKLVGPSATTNRPHLVSVAVPPGVRIEVHFVPVREGEWGLECTVFLHELFGMEGRITIQ